MKTLLLACALICAASPLAAQIPPAPTPPSLKQEMRLPWQADEGPFIQHWLILGEFPNPDRKALDVDFLGAQGGEAKVRPVAGMSVKRPDGSQAVWTDYQSRDNAIDLLRALPGRPSNNVVAYAYATVERSAAGRVLLSLGSDDGVAVWVNGKRVHRNPATRG